MAELDWDMLLVSGEFDKMIVLHNQLARLFGDYYSALIHYGCSEELAGTLVLERQSQLMHPPDLLADPTRPDSVDNSGGCNCGCGGK